MTEQQIEQTLVKTGVILKGHFKLTSGRHSDLFLQCSQLMQYPRYAGPICEQLATMFENQGVELVVGPAMGGVVMAYEVARALGVRSIFTEKDSGKMVLRRGFTVRPGEKVLVVEDAVSTGGSINEAIEAVVKKGAEIVGIGALVDRTAGRVRFDYPFKPLLTMDVKSWLPEECPLCAAGVPITAPKSAQILSV